MQAIVELWTLKYGRIINTNQGKKLKLHAKQNVEHVWMCYSGEEIENESIEKYDVLDEKHDVLEEKYIKK